MSVNSVFGTAAYNRVKTIYHRVWTRGHRLSSSSPVSKINKFPNLFTVVRPLSRFHIKS